MGKMAAPEKITMVAKSIMVANGVALLAGETHDTNHKRFSAPCGHFLAQPLHHPTIDATVNMLHTIRTHFRAKKGKKKAGLKGKQKSKAAWLGADYAQITPVS
jgi:hypothetical protein